MTDQISISGLPLSQPLTGNEVLPMDQESSTVQATAQQIANLAPKTDLGYVPTTRTLTSSTGEDIEIPEASATVSGLLPAAWISGTSPALFPHIHGSLAGTVHEHVRNVSGAVMPALTPYHVVGNHDDTDTVTIVPADASDPQTMPASGITLTELAASGTAANGHGVIAGVPTGVNTAGNPSSTVLYVGSGVLTPTPPAANVQALAIVGRSHATTGTLAMLSGPALARVAFSGDYNHLANRPTLGDSATRNVGTASTDVAAGDAPATALASHMADADPHPVYLKSAEILAGTNMSVDRTTTPGSVILNATGVGTPGGSSGEAQFNNTGAFAGASGLTYDATTGRLTLASFLAATGAPATPSSAGFVLYAAPTTGALSWRGASGFTRTLNATGITADRQYQFQDKSGTLAHLDDIRPDRYAVGNYIVPINTVLGPGNLLLADTISFLPFVVERSIQINELGARVAAAVASSNFQLAIYDTSNGLPTVPIVSTGSLSGAVLTNITGSVATTTLTAGRIYAAAVNGTAGIAFAAPVPGSSYGSSIIGTESLSLIIPTNSIGTWNRQLTQTYGTWPTVTGLTTGPFQVTRCPAPILRVSALL